MPLSEIVQQVGIRDDIQVGYDQPVDGAFAVTLNDTDNGHLVFEDGRTGVQPLKTKMLYEIPMNGISHWVRLL